MLFRNNEVKIEMGLKDLFFFDLYVLAIKDSAASS
jgi:hypothetical protein